jgi:5-methylcytosine-specific restriction endonuclease McrA
MMTKVRTRRCKVCKEPFTPFRSTLQRDCGKFECQHALALQYAEKEARKREKSERQAKAQERKVDREKREAMLKIPKLIARAQANFNAFIRERDKDKGCFVCGRPFNASVPGRVMHAGHVRSRAAAGHLRFNEQNCHGECEGCNGPHGAKPHQIKAGAIARIGLEAYEALEASNEPHHWKRDELIEISRKYRRLTRELRAAREAMEAT